MGQHKNLNHNIIRQAILDHCIEPKSAGVLSRELGIKEYTTYKTIEYLIANKYLELTGSELCNNGRTTRRLFKTLDVNYQPSNKASQKDALPLQGSRLISFDNPNMRKLLAETSQLTRQERKSPRVNVGISHIYG